ncbi:hypothetical protein [Streptomyces cadmiisoli]|uniref:hypothetical protein n=1 Tax=Streptomyces cadmiisoli TaxID=2184053 RepID=UPI003669CCDA
MTKRWWAPVLVNTLLGVPGVVPIWLLWYYAVNGPLADLGLTVREPTENDGMLGWLLITAVAFGLYGLFWWVCNRPLRHGTTLAPLTYWALGVLSTFVPTIALIIST